MAVPIESVEAELTMRNDLCRQAQLPLLDAEKELERYQRDEIERAYSNFFAAQARLHVQHLKDVKVTGWSQGQALYAAHLKIKQRLKPEVDQQWAEMVKDGSWQAWIEE